MEAILKRFILFIRAFLREKLHYRAEDLPFYTAIFIAAVVFVAALTGFLQITQELFQNDLTAFDSGMATFFVGLREENLTLFMLFMSYLGGGPGYVTIILLLILLLIFRRSNWRFSLQTVLVLVLATLSNMVLKVLINRTRPDGEHLMPVYTLSFPSGHAMSAMGFYGFLIFLVLRYARRTSLKIFLVTILVLIILFIGISRVYLGVHYPSDVVAGFAGGLIWVTFCVILFDVIDLMRKRKKRLRELQETKDDKAI